MILRKRHLLFTGVLLFNLTSCSQFKDQVQSTSESEVAPAALACPLSQSTFVPTDSDDFELVFQDQSTDDGVEESVDLTHRDRGVEFRFGFLRQEPDLYDWALIAVGIPGPASDITATPVFPVYAYDAQMRPTRADEQVKYISVDGLGDFYPQISKNPEFSADELRGKVWIKTCRTEAVESSSNSSKLEVGQPGNTDPIDASNLTSSTDASSTHNNQGSDGVSENEGNESLPSQEQAESISSIALEDIEVHCSELGGGNRLCESNLVLRITNDTEQPKIYAVVEAEIVDPRGIKLTDNVCFQKEYLVSLDKPVQPGETVTVVSHFRKYYEYSSASVKSIEWIDSAEEFNSKFEGTEGMCP